MARERLVVGTVDAGAGFSKTPFAADDTEVVPPTKSARERLVGTRGPRVRVCTGGGDCGIRERCVFLALPRTTEAGHPDHRKRRGSAWWGRAARVSWFARGEGIAGFESGACF